MRHSLHRFLASGTLNTLASYALYRLLLDFMPMPWASTFPWFLGSGARIARSGTMAFIGCCSPSCLCLGLQHFLACRHRGRVWPAAVLCLSANRREIRPAVGQ